MFAVVLALTGLANAATIPSAHSHKGATGYLTITTTTEVGGATLHPGDYQVKEVDSPRGPVVEFALYEVQEPPIWFAASKTVVARVNCTEQTLASRPKHTRLVFASDPTRATGLEIRGTAFEYDVIP
jgi:hypothetical protein